MAHQVSSDEAGKVDEVIGTTGDRESQIYFEVCMCKNSQKPRYGKTQGMGKTHRLREK